MKFHCGKPLLERLFDWVDKGIQEHIGYYAKWHTYFLWLPKRMGEGECRWLESIWRRGKFHSKKHIYDMAYWDWEFNVEKPKEEATPND